MNNASTSAGLAALNDSASSVSNGGGGQFRSPISYWAVLAQTVAFYILLATAAIGVLLNTYVLWKLGKIVRMKPYLNPAVVLRCMCAMDVFCGCFLVLYSTVAEIMLNADVIPVIGKRIFCKSLFFAVHVASALSMWCWMILSMQRFIAIVRPLLYHHHKYLQQPRHMTTIALVFFCVFESYFLITVEYLPAHPPYRAQSDCHEVTTLVSAENLTLLHSIDLVFTYFAPVLLMLVMDCTVRQTYRRQHVPIVKEPPLVTTSRSADHLFNAVAPRQDSAMRTLQSNTTVTSPILSSSGRDSSMLQLPSLDHSRRHSGHSAARSDADEDGSSASCSQTLVPDHLEMISEPLRSVVQRRQRRHRSRTILRRYLLLATLDLALNFPRVLLRLWDAYFTPTNSNTRIVLALCSYFCYYSQYSINVLYLWVLYPSVIRSNGSPGDSAAGAPAGTAGTAGTANNNVLLQRPVTATRSTSTNQL